MKRIGSFVSRGLLLVAGLTILCALSVSSALAGDLFYTTSGAGTGAPNGAELIAIEVSGGKVATTDIGPTHGGDCGSLALSPSGGLFSMCGPLFGGARGVPGSQQLATIDPKTGRADLFGIAVSGLSVMAMTFAPDGTLYAVGDCNPDPNFECNTSGSPPDPTTTRSTRSM